MVIQIGLYNVSSWRVTTYVMVALSLGIFLIQRTSYAMFDLVFEVCIFHFPALISAMIYLSFLGRSSS